MEFTEPHPIDQSLVPRLAESQPLMLDTLDAAWCRLSDRVITFTSSSRRRARHGPTPRERGVRGPPVRVRFPGVDGRASPKSPIRARNTLALALGATTVRSQCARACATCAQRLGLVTTRRLLQIGATHAQGVEPRVSRRRRSTTRPIGGVATQLACAAPRQPCTSGVDPRHSPTWTLSQPRTQQRADRAGSTTRRRAWHNEATGSRT